MSETSELLPCPFCGGPGKIESYIPISATGPRYPIYFGFCSPCEMRTKGHAKREWSVTDWNRRARWASFSDEELRELNRFIEHSHIYDTTTKVEDEIESELEQRKAEGGK
jgi:Restriction alleviation protein Lar